MGNLTTCVRNIIKELPKERTETRTFVMDLEEIDTKELALLRTIHNVTVAITKRVVDNRKPQWTVLVYCPSMEVDQSDTDPGKRIIGYVKHYFTI